MAADDSKSAEIWKPIPGYEDRYFVSNFGTVKRRTFANGIESIRLLKQTTTADGYRKVALSTDGKGKQFSVQRLVLAAFVRCPLPGEQANHLNGNQADNRLSNLEWCSQSENMRHRYYVLGRKPFGTANPSHKLSERQVTIIRAVHNGSSINHDDLAILCGVSRRTISDAACGVTWTEL